MKTATLDFDTIVRKLARDEAREEITRILEQRQGESKRSEYITLDQSKDEYYLYGATLYRKIKAGIVNLYTLGGKSLLKRSEVEALIVKCPPRKRPAPPKGEDHWKVKAKKAKARKTDND